MSSTEPPSPPGLKRQLGLGSATALVVGEVIGVGIFLTPAGMARSLGSPVGLLLVWLGMGAVTLAGALCFGELAARFPEAGGGYAYLREAYGPRWAFLFGWMALLVTDPGLTAMLATGAATYFGSIVSLSPAGLKAVAMGAIAVLAIVNILGVTLGATLMRGLAWLKLGLLAVLVLWGFGRGLGDWSNFVPLVAQRPGADPWPKALLGAAVLAFFSYAGWWDMSKLAGEVRDPERIVPRALALGVAVVAAVYILISAVFLYLVPPSRVTADQQGFAALAGQALFGSAGAKIFSAVVVATVLGSLASVIMAAPRVYYAMARDGLFLPAVAALDPRFGTPARAIMLQAVLACALVLSGTFEEILAYFFFATVAFLALIVASVYVLRRDPADWRALTTPGYPLTPLIFLVPIAVVLALIAIESPRRAGIGVAIVALGWPVYQLVKKPTGREPVKTA